MLENIYTEINNFIHENSTQSKFNMYLDKPKLLNITWTKKVKYLIKIFHKLTKPHTVSDEVLI